MLRGIFGANLRQLANGYSSIAGLCRELGINRTQFNRYLSSESFPRPDVLHRICQFFGVDARILLEPVENLGVQDGQGVLDHPAIAEYLGKESTYVPQQDFPDGFYRFSRPSFFDPTRFVVGLVFVFREGTHTFVRGFEPKEAMRMQGLSTSPRAREFRGIVLRQEQGVAALIARHGALTCSFNFLARIASYENNYWEGYATRTVREAQNSNRAARMVYEHIGGNTKAILETARNGGMKHREDLLPFHEKLLNVAAPFR